MGSSHLPRRINSLRRRVQTRLRSCLAAAYSAEVAFGYEGRACVSPLFFRSELIFRKGSGKKTAERGREKPGRAPLERNRFHVGQKLF